jgi:hypothetical protein
MGNLNEIVSDRYNGLHFRTNDPVDLQNIIGDFVLNHDKHSILYTNARKTYLAKYTHEINYGNLMAMYKDMILNNSNNQF